MTGCYYNNFRGTVLWKRGLKGFAFLVSGLVLGIIGATVSRNGHCPGVGAAKVRRATNALKPSIREKSMNVKSVTSMRLLKQAIIRTEPVRRTIANRTAKISQLHLLCERTRRPHVEPHPGAVSSTAPGTMGTAGFEQNCCIGGWRRRMDMDRRQRRRTTPSAPRRRSRLAERGAEGHHRIAADRQQMYDIVRTT